MQKNTSEIEIFTSKDGKTEIQVKLEGETVWLNQYQLEELFETNRTSITRHISNIYKSEELSKEATSAKIAQVQKEGNREITRQINFYNLDIIIAVGYRVNSKRGTEFRIWANKILKEFLIKGFSINEKRLSQQNEQLKELQESVKILGDVLHKKELTTDESTGLLKIISEYAYALDLIDQYDYQKLEIKETSGKEIYQLGYDEAIKQINLFPVSLEHAIDEDNEVRIIDLFVDSISLEDYGFKIEYVENGRPAYHPSDLLKLYIYGYLNKVRSSRDLEKECKRNIEVMWLIKALKPDLNTISNFRMDNPKAINKVFRATVQIAKHFDLIGGKLIAGDSSKFRAQNSKKNNYNQKKIDRHVSYIDKKLEEYNQVLAEQDGDNKQLIQHEIEKHQGRKKKYKQLIG